MYRLVADEIEDLGPLRQLPAFVALEADVAAFVADWLVTHPANGDGSRTGP